MIIKNGNYNLISNNNSSQQIGNAPIGTKVLRLFSKEDILNLFFKDTILNADEKEEFMLYLNKINQK